MAKLACFILLCIFNSSISDPIVSLPKGQIRGTTLKSVNNRTIYTFLGIPFAKPPLDQLRFKAPVEPEPWSGILNTTQDPKICYTSKFDSDLETEDCLYLNVVTPALNLNATTKKLPVLFSIYGGAFRTGSAAYGNHGPDWWVEQDIVFVNFNYRLGPFGFISTGDLVLPGNSGLKDQHLALKWTYENIHLFGGDRDKITIHGQSAGGASVTYQILYKKSEGMFRAAIAESGSVFSGWARLATPKQYAIDLITTMNNGLQPADNSSTSLYNFLLNASAKDIDNASQHMGNALALPTIELEHEGAFLTESQYTLMENGEYNKVPLIIGINSEEDIYKANDLNAFKETAKTYSENLTLLVPGSLGSLSAETKYIVGQTIKDLYAGYGNNFTENLGALVAYFSDTSFSRPTIRFAELHSQHAPVWFYQFSHKGKMGYQNNIELSGADLVAHGEEVHYYTVTRSGSFDNTKYDTFPESDVLTHFRLIELWSNFIKNLNPTPVPSSNLSNITWPAVTGTNFTYLNINATLEVRSDPKSPRFAAWKNIFETYGIKPFVTF